ncbi:phasin family protein [Cupriavidus necator]
MDCTSRGPARRSACLQRGKGFCLTGGALSPPAPSLIWHCNIDARGTPHSLPPVRIGIALRANLFLLADLTIKALEGLEQLFELNRQAIKASLAESRDRTHQAFSAKSVRELLALQTALMQPAGVQTLSYSRRFYDIALATRTEVAKATGAAFEDHNRRAKDLINNLMKSTPPGSEAAVGILVSVITASNRWCETLYQTATQAAEVGPNRTCTRARHVAGPPQRAART